MRCGVTSTPLVAAPRTISLSPHIIAADAKWLGAPIASFTDSHISCMGKLSVHCRRGKNLKRRP
jgi:hypothetical protein